MLLGGRSPEGRVLGWAAGCEAQRTAGLLPLFQVFSGQWKACGSWQGGLREGKILCQGHIEQKRKET